MDRDWCPLLATEPGRGRKQLRLERPGPFCFWVHPDTFHNTQIASASALVVDVHAHEREVANAVLRWSSEACSRNQPLKAAHSENCERGRTKEHSDVLLERVLVEQDGAVTRLGAGDLGGWRAQHLPASKLCTTGWWAIAKG